MVANQLCQQQLYSVVNGQSIWRTLGVNSHYNYVLRTERCEYLSKEYSSAVITVCIQVCQYVVTCHPDLIARQHTRGPNLPKNDSSYEKVIIF